MQRHLSFARPIALGAATLAGALLAAGCAASPPVQTTSLADTRTPLQVAMDSTLRLASYAAEASDTANVQARFAAGAQSLDDARRYMTTARSAAQSANRQASTAMVRGDWVLSMLAGGDDSEKPQYDHYWQMGRAKLDATRLRSDAAVTAADSALLCTAVACTSSRALRVQTEMQAAAGAAREAETLIRIALVHVRG